MASRSSAMTSGERVRAAIRRQPVDYVPCAPLVNPLTEAQRRGKPWNFPWDPPSEGLEYWVQVLGTDKVVGHWWLGSFFPGDRVTTRVWHEDGILHNSYETPSGVLHAAV